MKKVLYIFIIGTLLLYACDNTYPQKDINTIRATTTAHITLDQNLYQNGLLYTDNAHGSNYVGFLDYATMQGVPLCNKPNCTHKDASCVAFQCVGSTADAIHFVYNDQLYWFESGYEIVDNEDGTNTTPNIHSTMRQADLETGTVTDALTIEGFFTDGTGALRVENTLYLICSYSMHQLQNGTWAYNGCSQEQYLYVIDLETNQAENLGLVNDSPYVENSTIETGNSYGTNYTEVTLDGVFDGKLYMHYQYMERKEDMLTYVEAMDEGEINDADFPWIYEEKCYDPKTGVLSTCEMPYGVFVCEHGYVSANDNGSYTALDPDGKETQLSNKPYAMVQNRYWMYGGTCYDTTTDTIYQLAEPYQFSTVLAYVDGTYIVRCYDENGDITFASLTEKELLAR